MKSNSFRLERRFIDSAFLNVITLGKDTLAIFKINYTPGAEDQSRYNRMWDGTDTSTIMSLPAEWKNSSKEPDVLVTGKVDGNSFSLKTSGEGTVKEIYLNNQLAMVMQGSKPVRALVFHPVSTRQLKLFTILSSVPYSYFNYDSNSNELL